MSDNKCDNYDICKKYNIYGVCEPKSDFMVSGCVVYQKQVITILANIDEKLAKLLEK